MNELPLYLLFLSLLGLIILSAFFSGSETSLMAINRYRLQHLKSRNHKAATRVYNMLQKTDNLLSTILLGNNFVNILASAIATVIGLRLFGNSGIAIATGLLTFLILIFAEITPKTIAALNPEKFAFPASLILKAISKILSPIVWCLNIFTKLILKLLRIDNKQSQTHKLTKEEIRAVLIESKNLIRTSHYQMLLSIIDLENLTVEDIMIPRHEIYGIDIDADVEQITQTIINNNHTLLPVYKGSTSHCIGTIHIKDLIGTHHLNKQHIIDSIREPLFILEKSLLDEQLKNLQQQKTRIALVVDEYGDVQGLITLEDILAEIVGNFTTSSVNSEIHPQADGSFLVDGTILVRELNHALKLKLPIFSDAKTLNGLVLHELEHIPEIGTSIKIAEVTIEIITTKNTAIDTVKIVL